MGNTQSFHNLPNELISVIGNFIDIDTIVTLYSMVDSSFFSELTKIIESIFIKTKKVKEASLIFKYHFSKLNKISIKGNFNLDELYVLSKIQELKLINISSCIRNLQRFTCLHSLYLSNCSLKDNFLMQYNKPSVRGPQKQGFGVRPAGSINVNMLLNLNHLTIINCLLQNTVMKQ